MLANVPLGGPTESRLGSRTWAHETPDQRGDTSSKPLTPSRLGVSHRIRCSRGPLTEAETLPGTANLKSRDRPPLSTASGQTGERAIITGVPIFQEIEDGLCLDNYVTPGQKDRSSGNI